MIIAFVITGLGVGGAETMLFKLLQRMDRRRFTPHVVSLTTAGELGPHIAELGIPVHAMEMKTGMLSPLELFKLAGCLRRMQPDIVHTWMYHADLLGGLAARLAGISSLAWCIRHSNLDRAVNKRSTLAVVALCAYLSHWLPRRILVCSDAARELHINHGYAAEKMTVIPNGFDLSLFKPDAAARVQVRHALGIDPQAPLVGMVGRFDPQKNHLGFLKAMGSLHRRVPQARFVLAGLGVDTGNAALTKAALDAGIAECCHFLGPRNDVPRLMAALDAFTSSSVGEAFPNVLGEAMACGVPCAVTDVGDCAYIVGNTGKVVAANDMEGLALATESLLALSRDARERLGEEARARIKENFEIGRIVTRYEDFYEEIASPPRNKAPKEDA